MISLNSYSNLIPTAKPVEELPHDPQLSDDEVAFKLFESMLLEQMVHAPSLILDEDSEFAALANNDTLDWLKDEFVNIAQDAGVLSELSAVFTSQLNINKD